MENLILLVGQLEVIANSVDNTLVLLGPLDEDIADEDRERALSSRARTCVLTVLEQGSLDDLHNMSDKFWHYDHGRKPTNILDARIDELAQLIFIRAYNIWDMVRYGNVSENDRKQ